MSIKKIFFLGVLIICFLIISACQTKTISLSETELIIGIGEEIPLTVTSSHSEIIWTSSISEVAIYIDGNIVGLEAGTTVIRVAFKNALHIYAECVVVVLPEEEFKITYVFLDNGVINNPSIFTKSMLPIVLFPAQRDNYKFLGWYLDSNFSTKITEIAEIGNITLYARWKVLNLEEIVHIIYELNGGVNNPDNPETIYSSVLPFLLLPATKEGYNFLGWFDKNNQEVSYIKSDSDILIYLFAQWERRATRIIYHLNGGINHPDNPYEFRGSDLPISLLPATREGYQFMGWFIDLECSAGWPVLEILYDTGFDVILYANWAIIHTNQTNHLFKKD